MQEAPYAFGSTYAREAAFGEADWLARLDRWNGERGAGFPAIAGGRTCGIAGCLLDTSDPATADLVSMWTAPEERRAGVGRVLVESVAEWCRQRGVGILRLMVTGNNEGAIRFYERLGLQRTGRTEPYPNDPAVLEYEMARPVS